MPHAHILSNSLVGGGSMNPDKLSLNLPFATSKSLAASRGPTPTFTRGSRGTHNALGVLIANEILIPTGTSNGRNSWAIADGIINHALSYDGTRWVAGIDPGDFSQVAYYAANGSEWRPNKANWSGSGIPSEYIPIEATNDTTFVINAETNEPRFDHNSVTYACKGLLIEESRQNRTRYSYNNFTNAYWESTASNVTAADGVYPGPDGLINSCSSLTEIAGVAVSRHIHELTGEFTPVANTPYTISVWVKQTPTNPVRYVQLAFWISGFGSTAYMNFDIQSGVVGTGGAGITASSITAYPDGWYRITATATSVASPTASGFQLGFSTTSGAARTEAYTVVSPLKSIYLWGAQVEAGSFATSYIPTVATSLSRSADVCSITGSAFTGMWNISAGTLFSDLASEKGAVLRAVTAIGSSTAEQVAIGYDVTRVRTGSVDIGSFYTATTIVGKRAVAYASSQQAASQLGNVLSSTNAGLPSGISSLIIGGTTGTTTNVIVSTIRYYKKRLPNAKLQSLTV